MQLPGRSGGGGGMKLRMWFPALAVVSVFVLIKAFTAPLRGTPEAYPAAAAAAAAAEAAQRVYDEAFQGGYRGALRALEESARRAQRASAAAFAEAMPLCSRLASVFSRPPHTIELALSLEDDKEEGHPGVRLELLQDLKVHFMGKEPPYSAYVYASDDVISHHMRGGSPWEHDMVYSILRTLYRFAESRGLEREEVVFIDIGANLGTISLPVAAHGFRVLAFEPMFSNALALNLSLCTNSMAMQQRVQLVNKGLGDRPTNCSLYSVTGNVGDGTLRCGIDFKEPPPNAQGKPVKRAAIDVVRLDDVLRGQFASLKGRVAAVKMDVEGFEPQVVEGGREFFAEVAPPYMVTECTASLIQGATGENPGPWLLKMREMGYTVYSSTRAAIPPSMLAEYMCHEATVHFQREQDLPWERHLSPEPVGGAQKVDPNRDAPGGWAGFKDIVGPGGALDGGGFPGDNPNPWQDDRWQGLGN